MPNRPSSPDSRQPRSWRSRCANWAWVAALLVPATAVAQNTPDLTRAQEIVSTRCHLCHGAQGESTSAIYPRLAGQNAEYVARQLADFKSGKRKSDTMKPQAESLTPEEMAGLGAFFAGKKIGGRAVKDADLAAVGKYIFLRGNTFSGVPACTSCHGPQGHGTTQLPRLAGQHPRYIEDQLQQFNTRERTNDNAVMHTVASKLTALEMQAVAVYLSSLD